MVMMDIGGKANTFGVSFGCESLRVLVHMTCNHAYYYDIYMPCNTTAFAVKYLRDYLNLWTHQPRVDTLACLSQVAKAQC